MRDLETIHIAIETAETGHLVFGTLHTTTAPSTVDRIIDQFPPENRHRFASCCPSR
jgi:twitching motility protein PilT